MSLKCCYCLINPLLINIDKSWASIQFHFNNQFISLSRPFFSSYLIIIVRSHLLIHPPTQRNQMGEKNQSRFIFSRKRMEWTNKNTLAFWIILCFAFWRWIFLNFLAISLSYNVTDSYGCYMTMLLIVVLVWVNLYNETA